MAKTTISLNIPKSAAERAARSVLFDILGQYRVGDINHEQAAEAIEHWRTSVNASLQGEDAVERVAQTIREYCIGVSPASIQLSHGVERIYYAGLPVLELARAILATGLVPDEAAIRADNTANLISIIADIREKTGLGGKPMLNDLADAIAAEMDRRVADEREKALDKVCENLIVLSRGDESVIGAARVALNNAAVFICGADRAKRAIRSGGVK